MLLAGGPPLLHGDAFRDMAAVQWPGLNEYDSEAVIAAIHPHKLEKPTSPEM